MSAIAFIMAKNVIVHHIFLTKNVKKIYTILYREICV